MKDFKVVLTRYSKAMSVANPDYIVWKRFGKSVDAHDKPVPVDPTMRKTIGIAQLTLNAIGITLSIMGKRPNIPYFWKVASKFEMREREEISDCITEVLSQEGVDDPHKTIILLVQFEKYLAWADANLIETTDEVQDISDLIDSATKFLTGLLVHNYSLSLDKYESDALLAKWQNWESMEHPPIVFNTTENVITYVSDHAPQSPFTNENRVHDFAVVFKSGKGAIQIIKRDHDFPIDCRHVLKSLLNMRTNGNEHNACTDFNRNTTIFEAHRVASMLNQLSTK